MRSLKINVLFILAITLLCRTALGQQYKLAPLRVVASKLISDVKAAKTSKPGITATELAAAANIMLDKGGINFAMSFDPATCDRLRKVKAEQKDPTAPLVVGATLKSVDQDGASLALPEPVFPNSDTCNCYIELPVLQVTDSDFITVIS